jgi:hypothetical protein
MSVGCCANLAWWAVSMGWVAVKEADWAFEVVLRGRCGGRGMVEVAPRGREGRGTRSIAHVVAQCTTMVAQPPCFNFSLSAWIARSSSLSISFFVSLQYTLSCKWRVERMERVKVKIVEVESTSVWRFQEGGTMWQYEILRVEHDERIGSCEIGESVSFFFFHFNIHWVCYSSTQYIW